LSGRDLGEVRTEEAKSALSILGAHHYRLNYRRVGRWTKNTRSHCDTNRGLSARNSRLSRRPRRGLGTL
jgi:LmbE family N-acetylglucosaminyl deacetylase